MRLWSVVGIMLVLLAVKFFGLFSKSFSMGYEYDDADGERQYEIRKEMRERGMEVIR